MRAIALALLLPLFASPALASKPEPQEVELHFLPQPGDKLRQTIGVNMQMATNMLLGPDMTDEQRAKLLDKARKMSKGMHMSMQMTMRTEASEVDAKGDYLLHLRGEGGEFKSQVGDQPAKDMPNPMGSLELDALTNTSRQDFDILRVSGAPSALSNPKLLDGLAQGVLKQAFGAMSSLEGRRMKIGESVEVPFDLQMPMTQLPAQARVNATAVYTLKAIHHGIATFDTTIKMAMGLGASVNPNEGQPQKINVTMNGSGTGHLEYRIADRLPLRHDMNATMHMTVQLPGGASTQVEVEMKMLSHAERYR